MTKMIANAGQWQPGQSGNPKGRKPKHRPLTEILQRQGEEMVIIGGEAMSAKEALARKVWQFVTTGEVSLMGKRLEAQSVSEWASVVKWLYSHAEGSRSDEAEEEPEIIVRVKRENPYGN